MIIKVLLFIIVLIFIYEFYNTLYKMKEEYFTNNTPSLTPTPTPTQTPSPTPSNTNTNTNYYNNRNNIYTGDTTNETDISKLDTSDNYKIIIVNPDLEKNKTDNSNTIETSMRDIMTKYIPNEIGLVRPWIEVHSHIPDYSRILNYGICK